MTHENRRISGKLPWQSTISEIVGVRACPTVPFFSRQVLLQSSPCYMFVRVTPDIVSVAQ